MTGTRNPGLEASSELLLAEAEMRLAVRSGRVGLWALDLATRRARFSGEWKRQTGYEEHELGDDPLAWRGRVHPDDWVGLGDCIRAAFEKPGKECRLELRFRHKDGEYRWILLQGAVVFDGAGRPVQVVGSHLDITDRKRSELTVASLLAATAGRLGDDLFRSLVENLARALRVKHADGSWRWLEAVIPCRAGVN